MIGLGGGGTTVSFTRGFAATFFAAGFVVAAGFFFAVLATLCDAEPVDRLEAP